MDLKEFQEALISLSFLLIILSLAISIVSFFARPYLSLDQFQINYIIGLCIINLIFSPFYLFQALRVKKIYRLEIDYIIKYAKIMGISILIYFPHIIFLLTFLMMEIATLEKFISFSLLIFELMLTYIIIRHSYDLLFTDESERKANIIRNRRNYLE